MSSIYDKSSLVLIPSGTKSGKVFSQKPVNGDGDFTFSRSTAATRVNADGNIEKETQNLLLQSNTFDTANWLNYQLTRAGGQSGYDGSSDAWVFTKTATGFANIRQAFTAISGVYTYSAYLKAGTNTSVIMRCLGTSDHQWAINLSNGTSLYTSSNIIDTKIEDIGSGWYRCSMAFNANAVSNTYFYPEYPFNGTTAGSIYVQDAQLEQGLVARDYIETTTAAVEGGITDNVPRLDYTDSSCPALLLEPQRTNELTHSEYISGGDSNTTTTFNYGESPEGFNNSVKVEVNSSGYAQKAQSRGGLTANTTYTFSFWLSSESDSADMRIYDNSNGANIIGSTALTIPDSGWERVTQTFTTPAGCTSINVYCLANGGKTAGDVTITWGWQLEEGSYATSYIPTYGTSVTRNVDNMQIASGISDLVPQGTGTMYVEATIDDAVDTEGYLMRIEQASFANTIFIARSTAGNLFVSYRNNNSTIFSFQKNNVADTFKAAFAFESGNSVLYVNGEQIGTSSVTYTPAVTYDDLRVGGYGSTTANMSGVVSQALVFKTRLSNEELADLTTL